MGNRRHMELYPKHSPKSMFGPMAKWIKRYYHTQSRRRIRKMLYLGEEDIPNKQTDIKGRTHYMWY